MKKRDGFTGKLGFVLACIGSSVGMGNIWRFPVMVSLYGGLSYIIPYLIFVVLIANTGIVEEFALGRASKSGPVGAFSWATSQRGNPVAGKIIGIIPILGSLALAIGYTDVMGWIVKYLYMSISGDLYAMGTDLDVIGGTFAVTADTMGANLWIVITIIITFAIMSFGVAGGIEKVNKVLMPTLFFLFVGLGIYIATLPGSVDGYKYIFSLTPGALLNPKVWIYAFGQAFFSLSIAGNGSVIYGSYLPDNESIPTCAKNVAIFDTLASILASLVILPAMATAGAQVSSGGPGLMFIYLVELFNKMPGGRIFAVIFFVSVFFAGITSIINMYEAPVEFLQNFSNKARTVCVGLVLIVGCVVALFIQHITSQWMDVVSIYICPLGALLAAVMFFYVAKKDVVLAEVNKGSSKKLGDKFYILGKYVYVILTLLALILGAALGGIG